MSQIELDIRQINSYEEASEYCLYLSSFMTNTTLPNISVLSLSGKIVNEYTFLGLGSSYFQIHIIDPNEKGRKYFETLSYVIDFGGHTEFKRLELYKVKDLYILSESLSEMNKSDWFSSYQNIYSYYSKCNLKKKVSFL